MSYNFSERNEKFIQNFRGESSGIARTWEGTDVYGK
jgi:hypothetical protein